MCTVYGVEIEHWPSTTGYKVFAEKDGKLYSPFYSSHNDIYKPSNKFYIGQWTECNSQDGFNVFADKDSALTCANERNNLNIIPCDRRVVYRVQCYPVTKIGTWDCNYVLGRRSCGIVFHAGSILLEHEVQ